jgi:hypothetical protein
MSDYMDKAARNLAQAMYEVDHREDRLDPDESPEDYLLVAGYLLRAVLPDIEGPIQADERARVKEALREQAAEYRREANDTTGEGKERLQTAADVVECVERIIFDTPEDFRRRVNASIDDPDSPGWAAIRAADKARSK